MPRKTKVTCSNPLLSQNVDIVIGDSVYSTNPGGRGDNSEMCEEKCHVANLEILEVSAGVEVDAKGSKNMNGRGKHPRKIVPI